MKAMLSKSKGESTTKNLIILSLFQNILCKTTFPTRQLEILHVTENGLEARVKAINKGLGKLKASLRSVLTPDDEEIEIIPHLKGSTDFEVYEQVTIKPLLTVLPWDDNVKPNYTLNYQVLLQIVCSDLIKSVNAFILYSK